MVGTDGSAGADRAIDAAGGLAAALDTELWIANVIDETSEAALSQYARVEEASIGDVAVAAASRILRDAAGRAEATGARKIHTVRCSGNCAEELVAAAHEIAVKAIFVGRRGAGGRLAQALIGSVSQKLAGISPIMPVIVP